ncbi:S8 family serine peptidase [Patescibacteria group bacterium]|nr:S8 family serine peptidase [Patescibacteria group bacterium]
MLKISKILILVLIVSVVFGLLSQIFQSSAQEAKPLVAEKKELPKIIDKDKNKIFDNLEELLKGQPDEAVFNTIVLFEETLSNPLFEKVKEKIGGFSIKYQYKSISGIATTLNKGQIIALSHLPFVKQVEHDAEVIPFLDKANYWFGTKKARDDFGLDGNMDDSSSYSKDDIVVAVIDSGIDPNHVDLDGGKIIGWQDFATGEPEPYDQVQGCGGHGTHVSSIATGEGEGNSAYKGVVPGAALVGVKVLKRRGRDCVGSTSDVDAGIQWVIYNKDTYGINVMNMSIGIPGSSDGTDSTSLLVNQAVDAGIVAVISAGNEGPKKYTIGSPSAAEKAITVGAMADVEPGNPGSFGCGDAPGYGFYQICFSSRGPTADERIKPDISAPGVFIMAAQAGTTNGYIEYSGTSMSSPFIAGLAGLMLHADSALTPADIKTKIKNTALDWGPAGADIDYGAGRLDGYEAIKSAGGYSGTNIATPEHQYLTGSLTGTGDADWYNINVSDTSYPIAVTLIMPNWVSSSNPDFDLALYDTDGTTKLAESISITRQETVGYQPSSTGTYKLKVYSYAGSGDYFFDQSAGTAVVSISLTTDGTTPFEIVPLDSTIDTTPSGTNDVQTVRVDAGPVDLDIKSTVFCDNGNCWSFGTTNGDNQVVWKYSKDGSVWNIFEIANTLYPLDSNVPQTETRNLYLQLTMPTSTASSNEYGSTVTIVATAP